MTTATFNTVNVTSPATFSITSLLSFAIKAIEVRNQRSALNRLDHDALVDLGLSRADVKSEASRSLWVA
ncbi:MAG: DUF1127 domain-containing protein [Paracoccaceae bacterium]